MDNKYKKLGINTILVFIGKLGSGLIMFLMLPLYTMWLGPEQFGLADLVNTYSNILFSIATCCMAEAIFIFPKTADKEGKCKYFSSGIAVALVGILFVFVGAVFLKFEHFLHLGTFHDKSLQIALLSSCLFIQNYTQQFTRSIDRMKVYSISGIVLSTAIALYAFILIPHWGTDGYIYSIAFANITASVYSFFASGSYKYISFSSIDRTYAFELLKYGILLIPNSIMWWLVDGINRPIMEVKLGLATIGLYAVASKFPSVLNVISGAFSNAWGISVSEEYGKEDFSIYFNQIFKFVFILLLILSFLISLFSEQIISIFAAPEYIDAYKLLPILLLSVILSNGGSLVGGIFMAKKQSKYFFYSSCIGAVVSVGFTLCLVDRLGVYGVAWASVASFFVMLIARISYVWAEIDSIDIKYYVISILLYIIFVGVLFYLEGFVKYIACIFIIMFFLLMNRKTIISLLLLLKHKNH